MRDPAPFRPPFFQTTLERGHRRAYRCALSDPHGCINVLARALDAIDLSEPKAEVYLLGDYVPQRLAGEPDALFARRCAESLAFVRAYCDAHAAQVHALMGNHETLLTDGCPP